MKTIFILLIILAGLVPSGFAGPRLHKFPAADYVKTLKKVTDVMVNDVTSPVAASRYYAYINLAAQELIAAQKKNKALSFAGRIADFDGISLTENLRPHDIPQAVNLTVLRMGEALLPSGYLLRKESDSLLAAIKSEGNGNELKKIDDIVSQVVRQILSYSRKDGFTRLTNMPRYTPTNGDAWWQPTPPTFIAPVEPYWHTLRPFVLKSADQFKPKPPAAYDTSSNSSFYQQLREVYDVQNREVPEEQAIAMFWDCNPFAVQQIGHVEFGLKKISPAGHWIGITGIACQDKKLDLENTVLVHALVSIGIADANIACWDEKYRSNRVRPETAINKLIDPEWHPLLQTPPFPEYVSGHSVTSTTAAVILTRIFGSKFSFNDDTEVEFSLPVRKFSSFLDASQEAAVSRLYGGIHYRDAIDYGIQVGDDVGKWTVEHLISLIKKITGKQYANK